MNLTTDYAGLLTAILPVVIVFLGASLSLLAEAVLPQRLRWGTQVVLSLVVLIAALVSALVMWRGSPGSLAKDQTAMVMVDLPALGLWMLLLLFAALSVLLMAEREVYGGVSAFTPSGAAIPGSQEERSAGDARLEHSEVFTLLLFSVTGMMLFLASNDLVMMFVALEIMSLPLYLLSGLARRRRLLSQEAALKYFLLGAFASAFFLFGIALVFAYAGSFHLSVIDSMVGASSLSESVLIAGLLMMLVGLLFKVGIAPFHNWVPDVYTGAPTPVTAFMAVCTKIAAVGGLMRVLYVALGAERWNWQPVLAVAAILTMVVGAVIGLAQTDVKRLLAYSSITHAGYILVAIAGAAQVANNVHGFTSVSAVSFYLLTYGVATIPAFAMVTMVRDNGAEVTQLSGWAGIGRKNPVFGVVMAVFMLSFAGIPLTAGFMGKWAVFAAAFQGGWGWLALVGVLLSLVAAVYYLRVIAVMFFREPVEGPEVIDTSAATLIVVVLGLVGTIVLGIIPGPAMTFFQNAGEFLRLGMM
ncbi:NADH dehydrogenase subunit N [Raineyella antarctica]|uniref:NADH-quinone oxidoreductase subunit N n=1 Tax=Raineyella antarctica TaxID=1577474 RepID=A0A1G6GFV1_9ACTN|nr:NADH-quinone oxidoreductase subunit NuoN [Raineyella antarctica]SDB80703.1 NADH dehydrogenase subunit N [Raineyella antarctica]